ncbi:MAG: YbjQ family protein [Dehalococcoidales bacterium]|nr:YbjQ family protein [Dehalococcoidales bacterium]
MMVVTSPTIPGKNIVKTIGQVRGSTIRAKHLGKDIMAALSGVVGGEIGEYTEMMAEAREQALQRMIKDAESKGANAVISLSFGTSMVMQSAAECIAYGTGVIIE